MTMSQITFLIFAVICVACHQSRPEAPEPKPESQIENNSPWQNKIDLQESDDLSQALGGLTEDQISIELNREKVLVNVKLDKDSIIEGEDKQVLLTVTRNKVLHLPISLKIEVDKESTASAKDFEIKQTTIQLDKGEESKSIVIDIKNDTEVELLELIQLKILAPIYVELSHAHLFFSITDNDRSDLPKDATFNFVVNDEGTGFYDKSHSNIEIHNLNKIREDQRNESGSFKFDGKKDSFRIRNHMQINSAGPYKAKTLGFSFSTASDISSRQVIYEQGGWRRGLSAYIHQGKLFIGAYNFLDEDGGLTTPWGPAFLSAGIKKNESYVAFFELDAVSKTARAWLNGHLLGTVNNAGPLFSDSTRIGIGSVHKTSKFFDGVKARTGSYFKGSLANIRSYNRLLSKAEIISLTRTMTSRYKEYENELYIKKSHFSVLETNQTIVTDIHLKKPLPYDLELSISLSGSAKHEEDFKVDKTLTIPKHQTKAQLKVDILNDQFSEFDEQIAISLSNDKGIISRNSLHIEIKDDELFRPKNDLISWVTLNEGKEQHAINAPNFSIKKSKSDKIATLEESKELNLKSRYRKKTIALSFETSSGISERQILFKQGNEHSGINIYIDRGILYLLVFNEKRSRTADAWGKHFLSIKADPNTKYNLIFSFNSRKKTLVALLNNRFIENTQAEIGPLPKHQGSVDYGGASHGTQFHDSIRIKYGAFFKGEMFESIMFNRLLSPEEMKDLNSYLFNKYTFNYKPAQL